MCPGFAPASNTCKADANAYMLAVCGEPSNAGAHGNARLPLVLNVSILPALCKVCQEYCSLKFITTLLLQMYIQQKLRKLQGDAEYVYAPA